MPARETNRDRSVRSAPAIRPPLAPAWILAAAALALFGAVLGFRHLDHCEGLGCDFTIFHREGRLVWSQPMHIAPDWRLPPLAALGFAPLGALPLETASTLWTALGLALAALLAALCARELTSYERGARPALAAALVAGSLPVVHCLKWGQVSLLVSVGALMALRSRRSGGWALGLLAAYKLYPAGYALALAARRRWRALALAVVVALAAGLALPWIVIGPAATRALCVNLLASAPGRSAWANEHSDAYYGGQSLASSLERWFGDGGHVGLTDGQAPARLWALPAAVVRTAALLCSLAVLAATAWRLARRPGGSAHDTALCLTGVTLVAPPGWHHYFAFLPFAQAVSLGAPRAPRAAWIPATLSWAITALPLALLAVDERAYFRYSAWGGTTLAALLAWAALVALPGPAPQAGPMRRGRPAAS